MVHGGSRQLYGVIEIFRAIGSEYASLELVHRLDKDTSGCLILAKNIPILRQLQMILQSEKTIKTYKALLFGKMNQGKIIINYPLKKNTIRSGERVVTVDKNGKPASTIFFREHIFDNTTLAKIELLTGRTHQIRVHLDHIGHPVFGDEVYNGGEKRLKGISPLYRRDAARLLKPIRRQMLHARKLTFKHPGTGKELTFESAPPGDLQRLLRLLEQDAL